MNKFKKKIAIRPAFDKRSSDPRKNYGIHGCDMLFTLIGEKGAVTFLIYTGWHLPHVRKEFEMRMDHTFCHPMAADIGYHSYYPMYEDHEPREKICEYLGVPCYTDGSALYAEEFYLELVEKGSKGLWKKMIKYYKERFEDKDDGLNKPPTTL